MRAPESAATPVFLISSSANNRERKEGKKNSSLSADGEKTAGLVRDEERSNGGGRREETLKRTTFRLMSGKSSRQASIKTRLIFTSHHINILLAVIRAGKK